jgi:hypothetical protein
MPNTIRRLQEFAARYSYDGSVQIRFMPTGAVHLSWDQIYPKSHQIGDHCVNGENMRLAVDKAEDIAMRVAQGHQS